MNRKNRGIKMTMSKLGLGLNAMELLNAIEPSKQIKVKAEDGSNVYIRIMPCNDTSLECGILG